MTSISLPFERPFLWGSSVLAEPFCKVAELGMRLVSPLQPDLFNHYPTLIQEVAYRTFLVLGALFAISLCALSPIPILFSVLLLGTAAKFLRWIGFLLQRGGFSHIRGNATEQPAAPGVKVLTWNICGIGGGLSYKLGGVSPWRSRLGTILQKIASENPDVIVLQEVYDHALAEEIIAKLKNSYAHFFIDLGPALLGNVGGVMVITKNSVHQFKNISFDNNHWYLNRGFAVLELKDQNNMPCVRIIGTHFIDNKTSKSGKNDRIGQLHQILRFLGRPTLFVSPIRGKTHWKEVLLFLANPKPPLPTILVGDLNMELSREGKKLAPYLHHAYHGKELTCTNRLAYQYDQKIPSTWDETIDYFSAIKPAQEIYVRKANIADCRILDAFNRKTYDTKTALSDHRPLVGRVYWK